MRLAAGFMAAKHLFAASELGLFEALAKAHRPRIDALAARTGLDRAGRADQRRRHGGAGLARTPRRHLPQHDDRRRLPRRHHRPPTCVRLLRFWDKISYPAWTGVG